MIMKKLFRVLVCTLFFTCSLELIFAWGSWGHQRINYASIFGLPAEMRSFYYNHKDFISEESVIPDLRKYTLNDKAEFPRHYIDLEDYGPDPAALPRTMKEAKLKYDEKTLNKNGILPWYIQEVMEKLTKAFKDKRKSEILFLSADLGHYIADANMPLHTSSNHDGQLSDQRGIHAFWESQLPEYFGNNYKFRVKPAVYINDVNAESWRIVMASHNLKDSLLVIEKRLRSQYSKELQYKLDASGQVLKNKFGAAIHTREYALEYHTALNGMVEKQLLHAVQDLSNLWYTAWVDAGKPDLAPLDPAELTSRNKKFLKKDSRLISKGKLFGFKSDTEFE